MDQSQAKLICERVSISEKQVVDLTEALGSYMKHVAKLRDKSDEVVTKISQYSNSESINHSLKGVLEKFAHSLSIIADHRDACVRRLDAHVVGLLSPLEGQCKSLQEEIKETCNSREKETSRRKSLDKLKQRNPRNRQKILLAETDLARASADVDHSLRTLEASMERFEKQKFNATTNALRNLTKSEIALHVREIELLTLAYNDLALVDDEQDVEAFRTAIRSPLKEKKADRSRPKSSVLRGSLRNSLASLFSGNASGGPVQLEAHSESSGKTFSTNKETSAGHSSPASRIISLHGDDLEDFESNDSEDSSSTDTIHPTPPRFQRSISQPKLIG